MDKRKQAKAQAQAQAEATVQAEATENNAIMAREIIKKSLLTKDLLGSYLDADNKVKAVQYDSDNKLCEIDVTGDLAYKVSALKVIDDLESMSDKAKAYHIAEIKKDEVAKFGYKTKYDAVCMNVHAMDRTRVSKLNRVGAIFLDHTLLNQDGSPVYAFRDGIPANASISNLEECLTLLTDKDGVLINWLKVDVDTFSEDENKAICKRFVDKYINVKPDSLLHLALTQKAFRDELSKVKKGITTTTTGAQDNKPNGSNNKPNGSDNKPNGSDNKPEISPKQKCKQAIDILTAELGGNAEIMDCIANILDYVEKHFADTKAEADSQPEAQAEATAQAEAQ